jgi:hypothetical protein
LKSINLPGQITVILLTAIMIIFCACSQNFLSTAAATETSSSSQATSNSQKAPPSGNPAGTAKGGVSGIRGGSQVTFSSGNHSGRANGRASDSSLSASSITSKNPDTGDFSMIPMLCVLAALSAMIILVTVKKRAPHK